MDGSKESDIIAYTEVKCLLEYLPEEYVNKIPKKLKEFIENHSDEKYNIKIDKSSELSKQNFSQKAKDIIAVLKYNYWSTEEEKEILKKRFQENDNKYFTNLF